jgi:hypothetical protein
MAPIRIRTKVESDTLVLPELKLLIGKMVEIQVSEELEPFAGDPWAEAELAVRELSDYDFDASTAQREMDRRQSQDHLA